MTGILIIRPSTGLMSLSFNTGNTHGSLDLSTYDIPSTPNNQFKMELANYLGARLIGVRDVLGASVLLRNILKSKYYWEVGSIDKYVFWGSIYIGENDDTL